MSSTKPIRIPILGVNKYSATFGHALKDIDAFGKKAKQIGKSMLIGVTLPILAAGTASLKFSGELNAAMGNVETFMPGNTKRIEELRKEVQQLAIGVGKDTTDLAGGLYEVVSAFGDSAETSKKLAINAKAAAAGVSTTKDAIKLTSAVTKAYGDVSASATQHASDLAFMTVKLGQTTFPELAESIGRVTPLAQEMGVSMEEMFAVLATGTGVTGDAAEVNTQMASALNAFIKPNTTMVQLYDALGVSGGKALIQEHGFIGALRLVKERAALANVSLGELLGRKEAMILTLALTGAQMDTFNYKMAAMKDVTGATDEAFRAQTEGINNFGFLLAQTKQKLIVLAQGFSEVLEPAVGKLIKKTSPIIDWLGNLGPKSKIAIVAIAGIAAAIPPLLIGLGMITGAVIAISSPVSLWIAVVTAGVLAVAAVTGILIAKWGSVKSFFVSTWGFLTKLFHSRIGQFILLSNPITALPTLVINNWSKLKEFFFNLFTNIKESFSSFSKFLSDSPIGKFFGAVGASYGEVFKAAGKDAKSLGANVKGFGKWLLGSANGDSFFANGVPTGVPTGAAAMSSQMAEIRRTEISKKESTVKVEFENLPPGAKVRTEGQALPDLGLGFSMVTP